jgi:hypothetical protein
MFDKARRYIQRRREARAQARARLTRAVVGQTAAHLREPSPIAKGYLTIQTRPVDSDGKPTGEWENAGGANLVVTQAESIMAQMAIGAANSELSYIELGDPTAPATPPSLSDLGLEQSTGERKAVTLTAVGNVVTAEATWTASEGNGFVYTEAGLFNGILGSGLMFARKTFAGITKTASFEMRFTWMIVFLVNTQGGDCAGVSLVGPSTVAAFTVYNSGDDVPAGGEASVAATFDFAVGANHLDVFLNGQRLVPGVHYTEAGPTLTAPIGGPAANKGVNFNGFTLDLIGPGGGPDQVFLILRTLA